jgi:uncharacterized Ntn-hydrolase superfamily protein
VNLVSTFSITAFDQTAKEWGVAVASKFLAVGSVVPWAKAGVGAVATQAFANIKFGPEGLELLAQGRTAEETVSELTAADDGAEHRQIGVVDSNGGSASYTGESCFAWAGGLTGDHFAIQGNILAGQHVVEAMRDAFLETEAALADRMLAALFAGDRAGGDSRGRQSAAVLLVREAGGYLGMTDKALDLRVDDHPDPIPELQRLRTLHRLYLEPPAPETGIEIDDQLAEEIRSALTSREAFSGPVDGPFDDELEKALRDWMGIENLEMRWLGGPKIDRDVLDFLRSESRS